MKTEKCFDNISQISTEQKLFENSTNNYFIIKCNYCNENENRCIKFQTEKEFIFHLRNYHCNKENNFYICKYGQNNICPSVPLNGENEYSEHVFDFHLNKIKSFNKMSSSTTSFTSDVSSMTQNRFNVNSFTQNLSAVLLDPTRLKTDVHTFFTRHWGDNFVPRTNVPLAQNLPRVTIDCFKQYLSTTAKKHHQYLKTRRSLKNVTLNKNKERTNIDSNEVPSIFFTSNFLLNDIRIFESVFLEPQSSDLLISEAERRRFNELNNRSLVDIRHESYSSLNSLNSLYNQVPLEAANGYLFRPYKKLHNRLEYYHDIVGILLNYQLENKSEEFWRTVNSYSALSGDLESAIHKAQIARQKLKKTNEKIFEKSKQLVRLHWARKNCQRLLQKLDDIACLRDAQSTVQMLLNQNNFLKALECIKTAHEVLNNDLKGVICFRHLSSQLNEMHKAITKMLYEEFISLIQREFGRSIDSESEISYQESQLYPVLLGLIHCREFRFLQVLQTEINEAAKNTIRQVILNRFVESEFQLAGFDPSLGNLGEQITKMTFNQWFDTLTSVFNSLYLLCCRILCIQNLILENLTLVESLNIPVFSNESQFSVENKKITDDSDLIQSKDSEDKFQNLILKTTSNSDLSLSNNSDIISVKKKFNDDSVVSVTPTSAASILSLGCFDFRQLRLTIPYLLEHAIFCAEECAGKIIVPKSKGSFLEKTDPETFFKVIKLIDNFIEKCQNISNTFANNNVIIINKNSHSNLINENKYISPLRLLIQKQTTNFLFNFHEKKRQKLKQILDSEQWKPINIPPIFQSLIDKYNCDNKFCNIFSEKLFFNDFDDNNDNKKITNLNQNNKDYVIFNNEKFIVVSTALLLIRILAEYCGLIEIFTDRISELNMNVIEILKQFNSRTCQLVLGAGALKMVGLKTISVKTLALSCRSLQLIAKLILIIRKKFENYLPIEKQNTLRHFDQVLKDFDDHIDEITKRLLNVIDTYLINGLTEWQVSEKTPTQSFQFIVKQIGKFFSGYSSIMPPVLSMEMLIKIHQNFMLYFKQHLQARGISPHDSLTYGMASQDFDYYIENMKSFPDCQNFPNDTLSDVLQYNSNI